MAWPEVFITLTCHLIKSPPTSNHIAHENCVLYTLFYIIPHMNFLLLLYIMLIKNYDFYSNTLLFSGVFRFLYTFCIHFITSVLINVISIVFQHDCFCLVAEVVSLNHRYTLSILTRNAKQSMTLLHGSTCRV